MTILVGGDIVLPDSAQGWIESCREAKVRVVFDDVGMLGNACHNCGGLGVLSFKVVSAGPARSPFKTKKGETNFTIGQDWFKGRTIQFQCPMCNQQSPLALAERVMLMFETSGLEPIEREWNLDYYDRAPTGKEYGLKAAGRLLGQSPSPTGWLCLFGDYGRGKSGLLKCMVAAFIRAGVPARYVRAEDLLDSIRATFNDDTGESMNEVIDRFQNYKFLAIDEVDRIAMTDWAQAKLFSLLDARYNSRWTQATAMATNAHPDRLNPKLLYLASRLRDAERVPVGGVDLRGGQA